MILRCQVVTITRNRKGQPIRSAVVVAGDPITLGRSPQSSVYLPDPRVHLNHAVIRTNDLGKLYVEAQGAPLDVNGELQDRAKLRRGERILIGPYLITPEPPANSNHDFALAVEMVQALPEGLSGLRERSKLSLAATHLSKRALSWTVLAAVAGLAMFLPMAQAVSPRSRDEAPRRLPGPLKAVAWDAAWSPGRLSQGHHRLETDCGACHQVPFQPVSDAACRSCHKDTADHVRVTAGHPAVAVVVHCAECHKDHRGEDAPPVTESQRCAACHGSMKTRYPTSRLASVSDFATDHPEFKRSMVDVKTGRTERRSIDGTATLQEASGLKFPHDKHLVAGGVRAPTGRRVLECVDCHEKDEPNERFQPVRMADHCAECHRLEFEPSLSTRKAPHGSPEAVVTALREFYSRAAIGDVSIDVAEGDALDRRPRGPSAPPVATGALQWADRKADAVAADLIEKRSCIQCHTVSTVDGPVRWNIEPVLITSHWLPGAAFNHKAHGQSRCEKCHEARVSKASSDILIPTLAVCRTCHGGEQPRPGLLRSPCESCHTFHQQPLQGDGENPGAAAPSVRTRTRKGSRF